MLKHLGPPSSFQRIASKMLKKMTLAASMLLLLLPLILMTATTALPLDDYVIVNIFFFRNCWVVFSSGSGGILSVLAGIQSWQIVLFGLVPCRVKPDFDSCQVLAQMMDGNNCYWLTYFFLLL
jgi:hypothetical protein